MTDIKLNYGKWLNGEIDLLLITGVSGSGKTTLAEELKEQLGDKIEVINTDKQILSYLERNEFQKNGAEYLYKHSSGMLKELIENASLHKPTIIEGVHILLSDYELIKGLPLVIKDTDLLLSNERAALRSPEYAGMFTVMNNLIFNPQLEVLKSKIAI